MICVIEGCTGTARTKDLCTKHYQRLRKHGDARWEPPTKWDRFMSHVVRQGDCLIWTGARNAGGYGVSGYGLAHRFSYEQQVGRVPEGMELDHTCHSHDHGCFGGPACAHRACVNPAHLEPVVRRVNASRGRAGTVNATRERSKTLCKRGHPLRGENVRLSTAGARVCRSCQRLAQGRPVDLEMVTRISTGQSVGAAVRAEMQLTGLDGEA